MNLDIYLFKFINININMVNTRMTYIETEEVLNTDDIVAARR